MAETIAIGGKQFPKAGVYAAGAAVAGIVGYAWFTRGVRQSDQEAAAEAVKAATPSPVEEPTDSTDFSVIGGGPPPTTNADWGELVVQRLQQIGLDGPAVSSAVGKFLARKPLNKTEADLVRQAIRAGGYPPQDGPWTVIEEIPGVVVPPPPPPPPPVKKPAPPGKVGLLPKAHFMFGIGWDASPGATKYRVRIVQPDMFKAWQYRETTGTSMEFNAAVPKGHKAYAQVQAGNSAGWSADRNSNTAIAH